VKKVDQTIIIGAGPSQAKKNTSRDPRRMNWQVVSFLLDLLEPI